MQENTRTLGWKNFQAVFVDSGQSESVTAERCIYGTMSIDEIFPKATMSAVCAPQGLEKNASENYHHIPGGVMPCHLAWYVTLYLVGVIR